LANSTISPIVEQNLQGGEPMINIILDDAIKRIEMEEKTNPDNYSNIHSEIRELLFAMRTFRNFISNPTPDQLEQLESNTR
jgi:hypothetical protein